MFRPTSVLADLGRRYPPHARCKISAPPPCGGSKLLFQLSKVSFLWSTASRCGAKYPTSTSEGLQCTPGSAASRESFPEKYSNGNPCAPPTMWNSSGAFTHGPVARGVNLFQRNVRPLLLDHGQKRRACHARRNLRGLDVPGGDVIGDVAVLFFPHALRDPQRPKSGRNGTP